MVAIGAIAVLGASIAGAAVAPFKTADEQTIQYLGPGRDDSVAAVSEVRIAWFGPSGGEVGAPEPWHGALLAAEEENAAGGYHGRPFRLIPAWASGPWGAAVVSLTQRVFDDEVWAVIGAPDGAGTHLAEQVAVKVGVAIVSPGNTDPSVHSASSPWIFSLPPGDDVQAETLAGAIAGGARTRGPVVLATVGEHDARVARDLLEHALVERQVVPQVVELTTTDLRDDGIMRRVLSASPESVVVVAPAELAGRIVAELRKRGFAGRIFGSSPSATQAFRRAAGAAADGVIVPCARDRGPEWSAFAERYERRFGEPADESAARGYDAVRVVAASVRRSGLNRARLMDALHAQGAWTGAAGVVHWNARGRNTAGSGLGVWRGAALSPRDGG